MSSEPTTEPAGERDEEVAALRERVAALEAELADRAARANDALASAQDRTYWLDRWHVDLNSLMRRRAMQRLWRLMPLARSAYRGMRTAKSVVRQARLERRLGGDRDESGEPRRQLDLTGLDEAEAGKRLDAIDRMTTSGDQLELSVGRDGLRSRWVLEHVTPLWEVVAFRPGADAGGPDVYLLRRG